MPASNIQKKATMHKEDFTSEGMIKANLQLVADQVSGVMTQNRSLKNQVEQMESTIAKRDVEICSLRWTVDKVGSGDAEKKDLLATVVELKEKIVQLEAELKYQSVDGSTKCSTPLSNSSKNPLSDESEDKASNTGSYTTQSGDVLPLPPIAPAEMAPPGLNSEKGPSSQSSSQTSSQKTSSDEDAPPALDPIQKLARTVSPTAEPKSNSSEDVSTMVPFTPSTPGSDSWRIQMGGQSKYEAIQHNSQEAMFQRYQQAQAQGQTWERNVNGGNRNQNPYRANKFYTGDQSYEAPVEPEQENILMTELVRLCTKHDVDQRTIDWFLLPEYRQYWSTLLDKVTELDQRACSGDNQFRVKNPSAWLTKFFNTIRNHQPVKGQQMHHQQYNNVMSHQ